MKRLIICLSIFGMSFSFLQAKKENQNIFLYKEIMNKFGKKNRNGKNLRLEDYSFSDLFDVGISMSGLNENSVNLRLGGGLEGIGGLLEGFGIESIHNDAAMNMNVTSGIFFASTEMRPQITKRQKKIMARQDTLNSRIQELTRLEQKTLNYWSDKQEDAVDIEDVQYFSKITEDCSFFFNKCKEVAEKDKSFDVIIQQLNLKVILSAANIAQRVSRFIKIDGNKNLLDNQDRDKLISEVIIILRELRGLIAMTYGEMVVASDFKYLNIEKKE